LLQQILLSLWGFAARPLWNILVNRYRAFVGSLALFHNGITFQPEDSSSTTPLIGDVHAHDRTIEVGLKERGVLFHFERDHELFDSNRPRIIPTLEPGYLVDRVSLASSRHNGALPGSFLPQYQEKFHPRYPPLILYRETQWKCQNGVSINAAFARDLPFK
jgi:hypothetical protein